MDENRRPAVRRVENLDDLFLLNMPPKVDDENKKAHTTLQIELLVPYHNHPFKLYEGERFNDMVESIRELGVILPVIVRPIENERYEILSGHNRVNASKIAGLTEVPVIIKEYLSDDDALLIVTETNLIQRSFTDLQHSERAKALTEHHRALSRQGKRTDLLNEIEKLSNTYKIRDGTTSYQVGEKLRSADETGKIYSISGRTVSRYLRIYQLIGELKNRLDVEDIPFIAAIEISYLTDNEQLMVEVALVEYKFKVDMKKAFELRDYSESKKLNEETVYQILSGELGKKSKPKTPQPFKLKNRVYTKYFSPNQKAIEVEEIIDKALTEYFMNHPVEREEEKDAEEG